MPDVTLNLTTRPRWFFRPAFYAICLLAILGILTDLQRAGKWLADHAMSYEVE